MLNSLALRVLRMIEFKDFMITDKLSSIKNVLIVGSGKGGVGKSTLTSLLGLRLHHLGRSIGILDTDLHGSSIPYILGGESSISIEAIKGGFKPAELHGIKVMSLRMFVGDRPTPLRGDRKSEILKYMLSLTIWGSLDYLLIDLPPGMSDELLTLIKYLKGRHLVVTLPTKTSTDVTTRYVRFLENLNCDVPAIIINNLMNMDLSSQMIYINYRGIKSSAKYFVMPYIHGIEESLSKGMLPKESIKAIDEIIEYLRSID